MQFEVLGPLRVVAPDGKPVTLASATQRRMMSLLILRAGTPVSADYLGEHLDLSAGALRVVVSRLRRIVGSDALVTAPPGYELRNDSIDARRFERLLATAAQDPAAACSALAEALDLWRGDAYGEFAHEEWVAGEARRLSELHAAAVEDLAEIYVDAGEWTAAIGLLEPLIDEHPFRDRPRALLMRALADSGRRIDALRAYQAYRTFLAEEVGSDPSAAITALDREIARSGATDLESSVPSRGTVESFGAFLMTDIVGSTRLWSEQPDAMRADLEVHDDVLSCAIADHRGVTIAKGGDSFAAAFAGSADAVAAAIAAQQLLAATQWRSTPGLRVRMAVHLGAAQRRGDGWYGPPLNETARMSAVAHGGQIVVSESAAAQVNDVAFIDLGEHRLRDLDGTHQLFQAMAPGLATEFPSLRSMSRYVTNLPEQRNPLIGRDEHVGRVRGLLLDHRLVSLIGPGGVGKTRTAVEVAGQELGNFPGGVFFIDLTVAESDADVLAAVVSGTRVSVPPDEEPEEHLAAYLNDRRALLIVDNCEHVVDRAAAVIDGLLRAAPDLHVLATSREALQLAGESCVLVPPLDVDGPESAGVQLFTERAMTAGGGVVMDEHQLETVGEIARRLDGIPLAIELAAAQSRTLDPAQILTHLDDRFRFLNKGSRSAPARQRTLEAAVAWSYGLLGRDEQRVFRLITVCAGPFTLGTVARLLGIDEIEAAEQLDALVAKSLVTPIRYGGSSQGFSFLETLRDYGRRELAAALELDDAYMALEAALLPVSQSLEDWNALENEYLFAWDVAVVIEDATRRAAAARALAAGRRDAAALIFSSCAFRDEAGALEVALETVTPLSEARDELTPTAWRAAVAVKLSLERNMRRYEACITTAINMVAELDVDDPARGWFDMWRCALITAIAPEAGLAETDAALPYVRANAHQHLDLTASQLLGARVTGLAMLQRLDEARAAAEESLARAPVGMARDQSIANLLWILYVSGVTPDDKLLKEVGRQNQELSLAELCAAPGALCTVGSIEARAAKIVARARRRPPLDIATPYLLAFAWLAVEQDDHARAAELAAATEIFDTSTQIGLMYLWAKVQGTTAETWERDYAAMLLTYLSPAQEAAAMQGPVVLADEIERWEHRLQRRSLLVR